MPKILLLRNLRQEESIFKTSMGYVAILKPVWTIELDLISKHKTKLLT
jgi:hypothetical protein